MGVKKSTARSCCASLLRAGSASPTSRRCPKDWKSYKWPVTHSKQEARPAGGQDPLENWAETVIPNTQPNATIGDADLAMRSPNFVWDEGGEFCRAQLTGAGFDVDVTQFAKRIGDREIRLEFP